MMARRASFTALTTASVCSASGGLLDVRSVWLSGGWDQKGGGTKKGAGGAS